MATSNIQETGLEKGIYFLSPSTHEDFKDEEAFEGMSEEEINESLNEQFNDYVEHDLLDNMGDIKQELRVYNRRIEEWVDLCFFIEVKGCYYSGANLIIKVDEDFEDMEFSNTSEDKIERAIRKLEKIMAQHSTVLKVVGRASNGETFYEKA